MLTKWQELGCNPAATSDILHVGAVEEDDEPVQHGAGKGGELQDGVIGPEVSAAAVGVRPKTKNPETAATAGIKPGTRKLETADAVDIKPKTKNLETAKPANKMKLPKVSKNPIAWNATRKTCYAVGKTVLKPGHATLVPVQEPIGVPAGQGLDVMVLPCLLYTSPSPRD